MTNHRRLYLDAETSPNIVTTWAAGFKKTIPYQNIIKERALICVCYKWEGERKVHALTWDSNQCDKKLLETMVPILNEATEVVGHNGDNFDIKWLRTRCLFHDLDMYPVYTSVDTLKLARRYFLLNSNRMDYITKFLGFEGKIKTDYQLWSDILLQKCPKAMRKMVSYCKNDVLLLEKMFGRMNKYVPAKTTIAKRISHCPECGSDNVNVSKHRTTVQGYKKVQFQCNMCYKYHTVAASRFNSQAWIQEVV